MPAISYLRVSTKDQATRNGLEEGLSIPAQREAAQRKAEQLGAIIVNEFIEPGESGESTRRRALQDMLDYIAANPVRYCIINKVDRLARNRLDDAIIHSTLRGANISLVSVTENIDESPSGMLMHGILASMAEFYSLNLAQEVIKGIPRKPQSVAPRPKHRWVTSTCAAPTPKAGKSVTSNSTPNAPT